MQQLELNLQAIMTQYASFVSCVCESVIHKGVSVDQLCGYLLNLPAFKHSHKENTLLSGISDEILKSDTIYGVFNVLSLKYASYLNYNIFLSILKRFNINKSQEMIEYPKLLQDYINSHTLSNFVEIDSKLEKFTDASKKIVLKFDVELTSRVSEVFNLKKAVANILGLKISALRLLSIEEGCVLVTFLIPVNVADSIFIRDRKSIARKVKKFRALSVLWMKCDDFVFDFRSKIQNVKLDSYYKTSLHSISSKYEGDIRTIAI